MNVDRASAKQIHSLLSSKYNLDAFIVNHDDPHATEVPHPAFDSLAFVSNFTGSAGKAVITRNEGYLWTDFRYHLQAEKELFSSWILMKAGEKDVPTIKEFLRDNKELKRIGIDTSTTQYDAYCDLKEALTDRELVPLATSLIYEIWNNRPQLPMDHIFVHDLKYAGVAVDEKINKVRKSMTEKCADGLVLTNLDDVAYLFNLRGSDSECSPLFYAYGFIDAANVILFVDDAKLTSKVKDHLASFGVAIKGYNEVIEHLQSLGLDKSGYKLWVSPNSSMQICQSFLSNGSNFKLIKEHNPVTLMKVSVLNYIHKWCSR
ncbi:bifunctional Creatinase-Aminopeptidase P-Spt16 [Babesia duncani]|uniref:Bifunctional Creatinase-Aminopeptidase P-Spt16 n=1 Tax=Babesia duncani TaxID=323732 RepID=A0AAD9UP63_9APIC|nr:bifunctional Creatinase-Aminopeptidase P-Spt16 [Babesia duncani]